MSRRSARTAALLIAVGGASLLSSVPAAAQEALTTTPVPTTPIAGGFTHAAVGDLIYLAAQGRFGGNLFVTPLGLRPRRRTIIGFAPPTAWMCRRGRS